MTNKINGIDVSEWELKGVLIPITECKYFGGIGDCKESKGLCVSNDNCYFKQLKRLQQENEELKEKIAKFRWDNPYYDLYNNVVGQRDNLKRENEELKAENEQLKKPCLIMPKAIQINGTIYNRCNEVLKCQQK